MTLAKLASPMPFLLKPGKFTPDEWVIMQQHVNIGVKICQPLRTMRGVLPIIRHHHERWDGTGYPDGLKEDQIPMLAQIFQTIDIYDALTSERPYKKAFTPLEAIGILEEETTKGWRNPHLVRQFKGFIHEILSDQGRTSLEMTSLPQTA